MLEMYGYCVQETYIKLTHFETSCERMASSKFKVVELV